LCLTIKKRYHRAVVPNGTATERRLGIFRNVFLRKGYECKHCLIYRANAASRKCILNIIRSRLTAENRRNR
jgi:hypothetical protein